MRKSGRTNLIKSLWKTLSSRRLIAVFLLMVLILGLLTLGQTSSEGPTISIENGSGFYTLYSNGVYHLVVFSYTDNGAPLESQGFKIVFTNTTTQISKTVLGTIGDDGLAVVNFTSNETWYAQLYLHEPAGYRFSVGYGIGPSNSTKGFLSYLNVYDHGFRNKVGFVVFYVNTNGKKAPQTQFRLSYSSKDSGAVFAYGSSIAGGNNSNTVFRGTIDLGNAGNFSYTNLYPNYNSIPSNISTAFGTLQYNTSSGWKNVNNFYPTNGQYEVYVRPSQQFLEPQVYQAFFTTDILLVSLFGIILTILSFGYPRATRSIELLVAKPLSRSDIIVSKYFASLIFTSLAILSALVVLDLLLYYYFGIYLNAQTFFLVFGVSLLVGAIFSSLTFLVATVCKSFVSITALPLAILFFFYYIFGSFIAGLFKLLQTLNLVTSNKVPTYGIYLNPFQIVSGILQKLDRELGIGSASEQTLLPFSIQNMIIFLFLWAFVPILLAAVVWRRSDV